jgi:phage gp36-like protein
MAYAAVTDMVSRFGLNEMIRLSTPDGEELTEVNAGIVNARLADASAMIDTYLRKRYQVPVAVTPIPAELNRAACIMARYDLSMGGDKEPPEQTRLANKAVIEWLESIRDGKSVLSGAIPAGSESYAQVSVRGQNITNPAASGIVPAPYGDGFIQDGGCYDGGGW